MYTLTCAETEKRRAARNQLVGTRTAALDSIVGVVSLVGMRVREQELLTFGMSCVVMATTGLTNTSQKTCVQVITMSLQPAGTVLCEPTQLYNILTQVRYPKLPGDRIREFCTVAVDVFLQCDKSPAVVDDTYLLLFGKSTYHGLYDCSMT